MDTERRAASKVPELTVYFWIIKILSTGMGEATSDFFLHRKGTPSTAFLATVVLVAGIALAGSLALQFAARRYVAWTYWLAVVMVSVFGTMVADGLHVELHIPYVVSTVFFSFVLGGVFMAWFSSERTLSIHSITTPRREAFYWLTVMATFALGTAVGDLTAVTLGLGYLASGVMFAVLFALPAVGYWRFRLNAVFAFWFAYIVTRPLGASFADWMAVPPGRGGLGLGFGLVSVVLTILIAVFVAFLSITRKDVPDRAAERVANARRSRMIAEPEASA